MPRFAPLLVVPLVFGLATAACGDTPVPPVIPAISVDIPPVLDGVLNDPCWQNLPEYTNFVDTTTRKPVSLPTTAKICYDQTNIYVAFHAIHPDPKQLVAREIKRNGRIGNDDWVGIDIDSTNSHRDCSWFDSTAIGTQVEKIEGGSSNKIEWRGDWRTAAKIVSDGYNVEMAIPFSILKFNREQDTFGICFLRHQAKEQVTGQWPDLNGKWDNSLLADWKGLKLPWVRPRPVMMGYMLGNTGGGENGRIHQGFDLKYPFSNDTLGLLSVKPDFSTIEQAVESVDFSYTERYQSDSRPFFQEWNLGTPSALFYSRRVPDFDIGSRLVGKSDPLPPSVE